MEKGLRRMAQSIECCVRRIRIVLGEKCTEAIDVGPGFPMSRTKRTDVAASIDYAAGVFRAASLAASAIAIAVPGIAAAQSAPPGPRVDLSTPNSQCKAGAPGDVVVCGDRGDRGPSPYRLDPTVLDAERAKAGSTNPARVQDRSANANLCGTVGDECGGGMIPILGPALRVADAVVKAVQGEDWREAFRNGPSDYERYEEAKRKKSSIIVGVSVSNAPNANPALTGAAL